MNVFIVIKILTKKNKSLILLMLDLILNHLCLWA